MNLYKKIEIKESYFHTGFLYGFLAFFVVGIALGNEFISNMWIVIGYIIFDQIIYRVWVKKK